MHHFFVTPGQVRDGIIYIEGSDVNHMKNVLRMKVGEEVKVSDGNNRNYLAEVLEMNPETVSLKVLEETETDTELPNRIYLFQGLPKSDKMELIVQKAVELGAYEIIPVETRRAVVKLDEKKAAKKAERWNAIAASAAKQSGRGLVPEVRDLQNFKSALQYAKSLDVSLIPYELAESIAETKEIIGGIKRGESIGIFIGPEGGFEKEEVQLAVSQGIKPVTLGKRILRTETAGLAALAILMYHLES